MRNRLAGPRKNGNLVPANRFLIVIELGLGLLALLLSIANILEFVPGRFSFPLPQYDLGSYYFAAASLNDNSQSDLYELETLQTTARKMGYSGPIPPYVYPPIWATLLKPLARLPFGSAKVLWLGVNLLALWMATILLLQAFEISHSVRVAVLLGTALIAFPPVTLTFMLGQVNLILLALLGGIIALTRRSNAATWAEVMAGCLLGLTIAIKLFPALFLVYFVWQRRFRVVLWTGIAFITFSIIGIFGGGTTNTVSYFTHRLLDFGREGMQIWINQSILGVSERLFSEYSWTFDFPLVPEGRMTIDVIPIAHNLQLGRWIARAVSILLGATTLVIIWKRRKHANLYGDLPDWYDLGLLIALVLLAMPLVWDSSYALLLIPAAILAGQFLHMSQQRQHMTIVLGLLVYLLLVFLRFWYWLFVITPQPPAWTSAPGLAAVFILWLMMSILVTRDELLEQTSTEPSPNTRKDTGSG